MSFPTIASQELESRSLIQGGIFSSVYRAKWQNRSVIVKNYALKTLPSILIEEFKKEFEKDIKILYACRQSKQIIQLFGVAFETDQYSLVLEEMGSGTLYDVLHTNDKPLPWQPRRLSILLDIVRGLEFLHDQHLLHRNLKSKHVLLDAHFNAKLTHFYLSEVHKKLNVIKGSPTTATIRWQAPECFKRHFTATKASDMYSFGMIVWEVAARKIPFGSIVSEEDVLKTILEGGQETFPPLCPKEIASISSRCWNHAAEKRPTAPQIREELTRLSTDINCFHESENIPQPLQEWLKNAKKGEGESNKNPLREWIADEKIDSAALFTLFEKLLKLDPLFENLLHIESPFFFQKRKIRLEQFQNLERKRILWTQNTERGTNLSSTTKDKAEALASNGKILQDLLLDKEFTLDQLYIFFTSLKIHPDGRFRDVMEKGLKTRNISVDHFFLFGKIKRDWFSHASNAQKTENERFLENRQLLNELICDRTLSDRDLYLILFDLGIRPNGGFFDSTSTRSNLAEVFQIARDLSVQEFYKENGYQLNPSLSTAHQTKLTQFAKKPFESLITLNCHGAFSETKFVLPPHFYLLVPHPEGLQEPYIVQSPNQNNTFEELIAQNNGQLFLQPSSGGWFLYHPGEEVPNLSLAPWNDNEFEIWKNCYPSEASSLNLSKGVPKFTKAFARDKNMGNIKYREKVAEKIKVFAYTTLKAVVKSLEISKSSTPVLLIPFCCNAKSNQDPYISCEKYGNLSLEKVLENFAKK